MTSTRPALGRWSGADVDGTNRLVTVSCATSHFCVAGDDHGNVVTSKNPTGGPAAWTTETVDPGHWITGLSCPSAARCAGGDSAYQAVVGRRG